MVCEVQMSATAGKSLLCASTCLPAVLTIYRLRDSHHKGCAVTAIHQFFDVRSPYRRV